MNNIPVVKLGIIAVSRDCFPIQLSEKRRAAIKAAYKGELYECPVTVENEKDMEKALEDVNKAECNALVVFLGNFGPETPETLIAERFDGPCMYVAAAEGDGDMINGRGDAYCGMLNCSYNLKMRHLEAYIPEYPVGTADDIAKMIGDFVPVARAVIGVRNLKIITFGPRPQDFFACNAPIKGLMSWALRSKKTPNLIFLLLSKSMKTILVSRKFVQIWQKKWVKENITKTSMQEWHSSNLLFLTGQKLTKEQENTLHLLTNAGRHFRHSSDLNLAM